ncbi:hypothetical protein [Streptomyces sp. NPDC017448]|uniref:hypothetical protein n=1 Tax=Streptomyces sp. NPDC017448 TaxID=3364996 RepID=UPI0037A73E2F
MTIRNRSSGEADGTNWHHHELSAEGRGEFCMPWLLNEDGALKAKLTGLTVGASAVARPIPVDVRFRVPEDEFEDVTYPLIMLTQISVERAPEREHRGFVHIETLPEGVAAQGVPLFAEMPVPYEIDYQVQLFCRTVQHRTELVARLARFEFLPERFGFLTIPQDDTVRRLDLIGGPEMSAGRDSDGKRLFTATYRVRVSTELFLLGDPAPLPMVETVDLEVHPYIPGQPG